MKHLKIIVIIKVSPALVLVGNHDQQSSVSKIMSVMWSNTHHYRGLRSCLGPCVLHLNTSDSALYTPTQTRLHT
jgi:hypothetical protein